MHRFRFFAVPDQTAENWLVTEDELTHLTKVLKLAVGTEVEVTNGNGVSAIGTIKSIEKKSATVETLDKPNLEERGATTALALGSLKPSDIDEIVPMLVELGVDEIHVFGQVGVAKDRLKPKTAERWERIIRNAVKQSKRSFVPSISVHANLEEAMGIDGDFDHKIVLDEVDPAVFEGREISKSSSILIVVGGEKGLDDNERQLLRTKGFQPLRIGPHILRAKTAAVAAAAYAASTRML